MLKSSLLCDHCISLQKTITTIHSLQAGLSSSQSQLLDPEQVYMLTSQPLQLHMTPGTVAWQDTQLSISPPVLIVSSDPSTSSQTTSQDRSPASNNPYGSFQKIISLGIRTLDGAIVTVMENGTPAQFYCRLVSTDPKMEMEKVLVDVEEREVYPSPGQWVLVRLEGRWCRASLLDCDKGWWCDLVDMG